MHEMSIATSLADSLLELARQQHAARIEAVELEVGALRLVVPEALQMAFTAVTAGTLAEGATLKLLEVPAVAECRQCAARFEPTIDNYLCPHCHEADVQIVAGNDIVLKSVVCQTRDCPSTSS